MFTCARVLVWCLKQRKFTQRIMKLKTEDCTLNMSLLRILAVGGGPSQFLIVTFHSFS